MRRTAGVPPASERIGLSNIVKTKNPKSPRALPEIRNRTEPFVPFVVPSSESEIENPKSKIRGEWQPKILAFLCNWCSYAGADLAGVSRIQYPTNVRVIRVPCSGRINPLFIFSALRQGIDGVLVSGCHPGDCHYISGNLVARRKFALLKNWLEYVGIEPERVQFSWVSAAEGGRFAEILQKVVDGVKQVGPIQKLTKDI